MHRTTLAFIMNKRLTAILLTIIMLLGLFPASALAIEQLATIQYTGEYHDSAGVRFQELDYDTWNSLNQTEFSTISSDGSDGQVFVGLSSLSAGYQLLGWKVKLGNATEFTEYTGENTNYFDITLEVDDVCHWVGTPDTLSSFLKNMLGLPSSICNNLYGGIFVYSISNTPVVIEPIIGVVSSDVSELTIDTDSMTNGSASKSNVGDLYTLTAKPANGYMLDYWEYSTDGGETYPEENRIINDDQNTKADITFTLTEDRVYRAFFKPAHVLLLDKELEFSQYHWLVPPADSPFQHQKIKVGRRLSSEETESELVREGLDAQLSFYATAPSRLIQNKITGSVELYKNEDTDNPFWTKEFCKGDVGFYTDERCFIALLVEDIPYMDSITVKVTITHLDSGITTTSTRHYEFPEGAGIEKDDAGQARFEALDNLKEYYETNFSEKILEGTNTQTHHNLPEPVADGDGAYTTYDSFSAVRYLLRYAYEDAFNQIRWVSKTAEDVETDYNAAIARFESYAALNNEILAGKGEAYKDIDGVIKVLFYHNVGTGNIPSFAYVPGDSVVRDAVEAGMENYSPRKWTINGGSFITSMNTQAGDGYVKPGGWSSQIIYSRNHDWALGVASEPLADRDILIFGNTITPNQYVTLKDLPKKQELTWALGILAEKYELSQLKENTTFANALNLAYNWGVNGEGTAGVPLYPADLDAAQLVVDNALSSLMAAYPDVDFVRYDIPESVLNVINLIRAIGNVDPQSGDKIEDARSAYNALEALTYNGKDYTKEQVQALVSNYNVLLAAEAAYGYLSTSAGQAADVLGAALPELQSSYNENPLTGSIGGEWAVFGIARGGRDVTETTTKYLGKLNALLTEKGLDGIGGSKYTEYSRITLALSSLGIDAQKYQYAGKTYDFISKLTEFDNVTKQGINGPIFALLALDSKPYLPENTELRSQYVSYILDRQHDDGGWSLDDTKSEPSDTDVTAMVLQALSNYKNTEGVSAAISSGLATLKRMQDTTYGGFYSSGAYNAESTAQVIVALTALNIDPTNEDWTVEVGKDPVTALLSFYISDSKTFRHVLNGGADGMATEQAACALVAYDRYLNNQNALYVMGDAFTLSSDTRVSSITVNGTSATSGADNTFTVELPYGLELATLTAEDVVITTSSSKASVSDLATTDGGATWTFTVTAEDGTTANYTVQVTVAAEPVTKYGITIATVVGGTATVTTDPVTQAVEGATVTVSIANIEAGKQFKSITVTDAESGAVETTEATAWASYTFTMPAKAVTVAVEVEEIPVATYAVTFAVTDGENAAIAGVSITIAGQTLTTDANGKATIDLEDGTYAYSVKADGFDAITDGEVVVSGAAVAEAVTMTATVAEPDTCTVTFNVTGANGTLAAKVDDVAIKSGDVVQVGKTVIFTATPAEGYQVKEWTLAGQAVAGNKTNTLIVENLAADTTVTVEFEVIPTTPTDAKYTVTPVDDAAYNIGTTPDGISTMTVNSGVSGIKYFAVQVKSVTPHNGMESVVFTHLRNGAQLSLNVTKADFDTVDSAQAGFNVLPSDIVKAYIVDELTNAEDFNPTILQ